MKKFFAIIAVLFVGILYSDAQVRCGPSGNVPLCLGNNVVSFDSLNLENFGRPRLSSTLNTYVNPTACGIAPTPPQPPDCGVDTAVSFTVEGCTITNPCQTIERAFREIEKYDLADFPARINLANATYPYTTRVTQGPVGAGGIVVTGPIDGGGNCINRDLVLIRPPAGTGHGFGIAIQGREVTLQCMNISTETIPETGAHGIAFHGGVIGLVRNITFGTAEAAHVSCDEGSRCSFTGDYSVEGQAAYHLRVGNQALMFHIGRTVTFTTGTTYAYSTGFVSVERGGGMSLTANTFADSANISSNVTITNTSPAVVTWTAHGRSVNDPIVFGLSGGLGGLPLGITAGAVYYVESVPTADTFTVKGTLTGAAVNTSSAGSGTFTARLAPVITGRKFYVASGGWITPGFVPDLEKSVAQDLPGTLTGQVDSGGVYFTSGSNIGPVSSVAASATVSIGFQQNTEINVTGASTSISSFGANDDSAIGMYRFLNFENNHIIFNNNPVSKSYILTPDGKPMFVTAGDRIFATFIGGNVWRTYWINRTQLPSGQNYIVNPSFDVWQAGTSFAINAATFTADRWSAQRGVAGATVLRAAGASGSRAEYSMRVQRDAANAATTGVNVVQQLESRMARQLAGQSVVFTCPFETGADYSPTTYPNIIIYTGTGANEAYSHTIPGFTTGNVSSGNLGTLLPTFGASTTGTLVSNNYVMPTGILQAAIRMVWSYPAVAAGANDWISLSNCKLEIGRAATPFQAVPKAQVLDEVMRRYQKSFLEATAPAQNVGVGTGEFRAGSTITAAAAGTLGTIPFAQQMALTATGSLPTCTLYNPAAANAQVRNITDGADLSASSAANVGQMGFEVQTTGSAGTIIGETLGVHWTCDSRM